MRVQIDDARHQREAAGIDDLGTVLADLADRRDAAVPDCDISADRVVPEPIEHNGAADHEVVHLRVLCFLGALMSSIENV
jgi:hypothetical protein